MTIAATTQAGASSSARAEKSSRRAAGRRPGLAVSAERQQAIRDVMRALAPDRGRLGAGQLRSVSTALAARRDLWSDLVVRDPDVRWYLPLHRSRSVDVWLLAWERGQDTDWHDHGGSAGSLTVAEGSLLEQYRARWNSASSRVRCLAGSSSAGTTAARSLA